MKWSLPVAAFSLATLVGSLARAQVDFEWRAPPQCPQESEVEAKVRALAGSSLDGRAQLKAEAVVEEVGRGFRLRLRVTEGEVVRERVIVAESCADLAGAAAVALVFLLQDEQANPDSTTPPEGETPATEPGETTPPTSSTGVASSPPSSSAKGGESDAPGSEPTIYELPDTEEPDTPGRWDALIRVPVLALDLGPLPHPSVGFGLGGGVRYDTLRLVVVGQWSLKQTVDATVSGVSAELQRATGVISLCRGWVRGRLELSPCLALALEHVDARGQGTNVAGRSASAQWVAPGAEVTLHVHLFERWALLAAISGRYEAGQPRLVIQELGELRQLAPLGAGALLGAEWIP